MNFQANSIAFGTILSIFQRTSFKKTFFLLTLFVFLPSFNIYAQDVPAKPSSNKCNRILEAKKKKAASSQPQTALLPPDPDALVTFGQLETLLQRFADQIRSELRSDLRSEIGKVRSDLRSEIGKVRSEVGKLHEKVLTRFISDIYRGHIHFDRQQIFSNVKFTIKGKPNSGGEFDGLVFDELENKVLFWEVKTTLNRKDITDFLKKILHFLENIDKVKYKKKNFSLPQFLDFTGKMEIHAALAFVHESHPGRANIEAAKKKGLSVIEIIDSTAEISDPTHFTYNSIYLFSHSLNKTSGEMEYFISKSP